MPILTINTNVSADKVPKDFKSQASKLVASTLGKPESYVAIHIKPGQDLSFGGTEEPAAVCDLVSIGALSVEDNKKHSKEIMQLIEDKLHVKSNRVYISFHNMDKSNIGFKGTTFHTLL